jgi:hypothetical protein
MQRRGLLGAASLLAVLVTLGLAPVMAQQEPIVFGVITPLSPPGETPEDYVAAVLKINRFAIDEFRSLDNSIGVLAQWREDFFIHCWYLFDGDERSDIWKTYGADGVAVCSRYDLLCNAAATFTPRPHIGIVQYGTGHLHGRYNVQQFITTKRPEFANDRELRLGLWHINPLASPNRHWDIKNVPHRRPLFDWIDERRQPCFLRQTVDLQRLVTEIVVSPYADDPTRAEVIQLVNDVGLEIPVRDSSLRRFAALRASRYRFAV